MSLQASFISDPTATVQNSPGGTSQVVLKSVQTCNCSSQLVSWSDCVIPPVKEDNSGICLSHLVLETVRMWEQERVAPPPPTPDLFYWLAIKYCLRFPHSSRTVGEQHTKGLSVQQKQMFALQKMIRTHGRAARAPEALQVPFGGQWQSKPEMQGIQRALQGLLSRSSLTFIFTLVNQPWEGGQEQPDLYLMSLRHLRFSQFPPNKRGIF